MNNVIEIICCNALKEASLFQFIFEKINENKNPKTELVWFIAIERQNVAMKKEYVWLIAVNPLLLLLLLLFI